MLEFLIPDEYLGKDIEIIAYAIEEAQPVSMKAELKSFNTLILPTKGFKFNRDDVYER